MRVSCECGLDAGCWPGFDDPTVVQHSSKFEQRKGRLRSLQ